MEKMRGREKRRGAIMEKKREVVGNERGVWGVKCLGVEGSRGE